MSASARVAGRLSVDELLREYEAHDCKPAVNVIHRIDHYSTMLTIVVVLVPIGVRARRRRPGRD